MTGSGWSIRGAAHVVHRQRTWLMLKRHPVETSAGRPSGAQRTGCGLGS
jgi:hypothetical protein